LTTTLIRNLACCILAALRYSIQTVVKQSVSRHLTSHTRDAPTCRSMFSRCLKPCSSGSLSWLDQQLSLRSARRAKRPMMLFPPPRSCGFAAASGAGAVSCPSKPWILTKSTSCSEVPGGAAPVPPLQCFRRRSPPIRGAQLRRVCCDPARVAPPWWQTLSKPFLSDIPRRRTWRMAT